MALEAELIFATTSRGMVWESVEGMELWQIASALGLHRLETRAQRDQREIFEAKADYFEETKDARLEKVAGYSERRAESKRRRREERLGQREEKVDAR
jgi:hypothetical protein